MIPRTAAALALATAALALGTAATARAERPVAPCNLSVYVSDPDPKGVNLRAAPNGKSKVVAVIPKHGDGTSVKITGTLNGWLRVEVAENMDGKVVFMGTAWGHASRFGANSQKQAVLRAAPSPNARILARLPEDQDLAVLGCKGAWLYVRSKRGTGWVAPDKFCGNPVTTCS